MAKKYIHFTDYKGAEGILDSGELWQSSFGPAGAVFAVVEGAAFVPKVQLTNQGRASNRQVAVVFTTSFLPDYAVPEEVMWHLDKLPIEIVDIIDVEDAKKLLSDTIPEDEDLNLLQMPLHPAFNEWGDWTRMPENFVPWTPGTDNEKYLQARNIWLKTKNVEKVKKFWNEEKLQEMKKLISLVIKELL